VFEVRNSGVADSASISHVYLFCLPPSETPLFPAMMTRASGSPRYESLKAATAADPDKEKLKLTIQYRLPVQLPSIPPGGVEVLSCYLEIRAQRDEGIIAPFCLRFHTRGAILDFPFRIAYHRPPRRINESS